MSRTTLDPNTLIPLAKMPALVHMSRRTVKRWVDRGILPTVTIGASVYVRRADLEAMLGLDDAHGNDSESTDTPPDAA